MHPEGLSFRCAPCAQQGLELRCAPRGLGVCVRACGARVRLSVPFVFGRVRVSRVCRCMCVHAAMVYVCVHVCVCARMRMLCMRASAYVRGSVCVFARMNGGTYTSAGYV